MQSCITECYKADRSGKPMDELLKKNEEYQNSRDRYQCLLQQVRERLGSKGQDDGLCLKLDDAVGEYSSSYGDTAYTLGFHDGMEVEQEHHEIASMSRQEETMYGFSPEDMADLICVLDAYRGLNEYLHGSEVMPCFNEGILGKMSRIYKVINNHLSPKFQQEETGEEKKILSDTSLEPEKRAGLLMAE